jgi:hypothetical protein
MGTITVEALAERMDDMECENQRLRREMQRLKWGLNFGGTAMLVGLFAWPHIAGVPRSIRSEQFVLQDPAGRVRAILGSKPGLAKQGWLDVVLAPLGLRGRAMSVSGVFGPCLRVFDEKEGQRVALGLNMETGGMPFLTFSDPAEKDRFAIYTMDDGGTTVVLRDAQAKSRVSLSTSAQGHGVMSIQDQAGAFRFLAPMTSSVKP